MKQRGIEWIKWVNTKWINELTQFKLNEINVTKWKLSGIKEIEGVDCDMNVEAMSRKENWWNGMKAKQPQFSEINETQVKLKELKQRSMNWIQPSEFKKARRSDWGIRCVHFISFPWNERKLKRNWTETKP